jgi:hypothetical protein
MEKAIQLAVRTVTIAAMARKLRIAEDVAGTVAVIGVPRDQWDQGREKRNDPEGVGAALRGVCRSNVKDSFKDGEGQWGDDRGFF